MAGFDETWKKNREKKQQYNIKETMHHLPV